MKHYVFQYCKLDSIFADVKAMKKFMILFLPVILFAISPFETPEPSHFNLSVFNTKKTKENIEATKNQKIKCRYVCDKKVYNEQKIADAISFYKSTKGSK